VVEAQRPAPAAYGDINKLATVTATLQRFFCQQSSDIRSATYITHHRRW